jgi:hypothetical protein
VTDKPVTTQSQRVSNNSLAKMISENDREYAKMKRFHIGQQEYDFWQRRAIEARGWGIIINISNLYFQITALLKPMTPEHRIVNYGYFASSFVSWALIIRTYSKPERLQRNVEIVLFLAHLRNLIRVWDFEKTRDLFEDTNYFQFLVVS